MELLTYPIVRDAQDLRRLASHAGGVENIFQLRPEERTASASRWTVRHLVAYRLLSRPHEQWPPALRTTHHEQCPLCADVSSDNERSHASHTKVNPFWVNVLTGETPTGLTHSSESQLAALPGGFFWVALARAVNRRLATVKRSYPKRERQVIDRQDFMNTVEVIDGSSSPVPRSSSDFEPDPNFFDEDDYRVRGNQPEEVTVCLIINFLQFALSYCLVQSDTGVETCARLERRNTSTQMLRSVQIVAQDDGGIQQMTRLQGRGWKVTNPCLALLEAKRGSTHLNYDIDADQYTPISSKKLLAQLLGEAVVSWKSARKTWIRDNVIFTIAANSSFICFFQFEFGPDYMEYLDAPDESVQQAIIDDKGETAVVSVTQTDWMNLETPSGRQRALCIIIALFKWQAEWCLHDAESSSDSDDNYDDMGSDMQADEE